MRRQWWQYHSHTTLRNKTTPKRTPSSGVCKNGATSGSHSMRATRRRGGAGDRIQKGRRFDAITMVSSFVKRCDFGDCSELMGSGFCFSCRWSSSIAGVRATDKPGPRLYLDTWLLGVEPRWILLGARNVGTCTWSRLPLDTGLLGIFGGTVLLAPRFLGADRGILRRH